MKGESYGSDGKNWCWPEPVTRASSLAPMGCSPGGPRRLHLPSFGPSQSSGSGSETWGRPSRAVGARPGGGRCGAPAGAYLSRGCRRPRPAAPRTPAGLSSLPRRPLESKVHKSWGETERETDRQRERAPPLRAAPRPQHARWRAAAGTRRGTRTLPQLYKPRGDVTAVPPSPPDEAPSLLPLRPPSPSPPAPSAPSPPLRARRR